MFVTTVSLFAVLSILEKSPFSLSYILPVVEAAGGDCMCKLGIHLKAREIQLLHIINLDPFKFLPIEVRTKRTILSGEFFPFSAQGEIECFECNSFNDPRCHDPFNYTIHDDDMPEIKMCEGCCVKMVQFIGTGMYNTEIDESKIL